MRVSLGRGKDQNGSNVDLYRVLSKIHRSVVITASQRERERDGQRVVRCSSLPHTYSPLRIPPHIYKYPTFTSTYGVSILRPPATLLATIGGWTCSVVNATNNGQGRWHMTKGGTALASTNRKTFLLRRTAMQIRHNQHVVR